MAITDTAVHDIDLTRWMFGEEIVAAQVLKPRKNSLGGELEDPLLLVFETSSGALVDVETSVNIRYGYDIRGEVVGESGTAALGDFSPVTVGGTTSSPVGCRRTGASDSFPPTTPSSRNGSIGVRDGGTYGPSSYDGYAAAVVSDAAVEALHSGDRIAVKLIDKPALYT